MLLAMRTLRLACSVSLPIVTLLPLLLIAAATQAQLPGEPVHQGTGPVSELSTHVGAGSGPVRGAGGSLRQGAPGQLSGRSVRGSVTGDVTSGPLSDISADAVTSSVPVTGGGSVGDASVGAVMKDAASPLGERISDPLRELGPLQEQLRALQPLPRFTPLPSEQRAQEDAAAPDLEAPETAPLEYGELQEPPSEAPVDSAGELSDSVAADAHGVERDVVEAVDPDEEPVAQQPTPELLFDAPVAYP